MSSFWRSVLLAVLILSLSLVAVGKDKQSDRLPGIDVPDGWTVSTVLKSGKCDCDWIVTAPEGVLTIKELIHAGKGGIAVQLPFTAPKEIRGVNHAMRVSDGWLLGADHGEFGGGLWWASADGTQLVKILGENVRAIVSGQSGALVFTGLAHLGFDYGKLYRITGAGAATQSTFLQDLGSAPTVAVAKPNDLTSVLAITNKALMEISPSGSVRIVHNVTDLGGRYPNSVVAGKDGNIYVGMRSLVLRLVPSASGYQEQWLLPKRCGRAGH